MKNPTPRQIALITAGLVTVFFAGLGVLVAFITNNIQLLIYGAPAAAVGFLMTYLLIKYYLDRFIYRKIKLIYKTIHRLKASKQEPQYGQNIIDDVDTKVREWAEEKGKEIAHLQDRERFRREFMGNVAHELKTPIFNIQGYLETLLESGLEDEKINMQYLHKAAGNVNRLMEVVNDLTTINTLESGKQLPEPADFDLRTLTKEVFESLEMQADANDIKLSVKEGCDKPFHVRADMNMVRQVLVNLLTNAIKYGPESQGNVKVGFYDMDDRLLVEVSDNGVGIPEKDIDRVFERFYRVESSRSRDRGGTGLGLSIVKHIVEAHGQTLNVRSKTGVGSTFGFTLPKA